MLQLVVAKALDYQRGFAVVVVGVLMRWMCHHGIHSQVRVDELDEAHVPFQMLIVVHLQDSGSDLEGGEAPPGSHYGAIHIVGYDLGDLVWWSRFHVERLDC